MFKMSITLAAYPPDSSQLFNV